jgi:hypothetical protein
MPNVGTVFLSFRSPETEDAAQIRALLEPRWTVLTHPVSRAARDTWRRDCERMIGEADAMICIVGEHTAESENVDWELQQALERRRIPVIAVRAQKRDAPMLPERLGGAEVLERAALPGRLDEVSLERTA